MTRPNETRSNETQTKRLKKIDKKKQKTNNQDTQTIFVLFLVTSCTIRDLWHRRAAIGQDGALTGQEKRQDSSVKRPFPVCTVSFSSARPV